MSQTDPLIVDVYEGDLNGHPDWKGWAAAGDPWNVAVLKATEGLHYRPDWFGRNWSAIRDADVGSTARYRGAYHYLRADQGGPAQATYYLDAIAAAGGFRAYDDLPLIVDVERAGNGTATKQQLIDVTSSFTETAKARSGRKVILYGGELLASLGITDRMGCDWLWIARYTPTLPRDVYARIGWDIEHLFAWQYCGDGEAELRGYPHVSALGKTDISAVTIAGGGTAALGWLHDNCKAT